MTESRAKTAESEPVRQVKDNLFTIVKSFNEEVLAKDGKTQNICVDRPESLVESLYDYSCRLEHSGLVPFVHQDPNINCLSAMGGVLLSWSIAVASAKVCNFANEYESDEKRKAELDALRKQFLDYLQNIYTVAISIAPRLNAKNSPICDEGSGADTTPKPSTEVTQGDETLE